MKGINPLKERSRWRIVAAALPHFHFAEMRLLNTLHLAMAEAGEASLAISSAALARRAGLSRQAVYYSVKNMADLGVLHVESSAPGGGPDRYQIDFDALSALDAPLRVKRRAAPKSAADRAQDRAKARPRERGRARERDRSPV